MFLPCPHCGFLVARVASRQDAPQHCPRCKGTLQAVDADDATAAVAPDAASSVAAADKDSAALASAAPARTGPPEDYQPAVEPGPATIPRPRHAPSFARRHRAPGARGRRWPGWFAVAALLLVLALQLVLAQRAELAAHARWRPLVAGVCTALPCDLPPWREPAAFTMLGRNVQPKPGAPGVLLVEASFRNDAAWPQPWPRLQLSLADSDGREVGRRTFLPAEYRGGADGVEALLAPGQSASARFEVREPAPRIVAFNFDFG